MKKLLSQVGPGRLTYEVVLAVALAAASAAFSVVTGKASHPVLVVVVIAALVLVPLRHRFPASALIGAALVALVPGAVDTVLLFGLGHSAGMRIGQVWRLAAALGAVLVIEVVGGGISNGGLSVGTMLVSASIVVVMCVFPAVLARMSAQRRQIVTLLHERAVYLGRQQQIIADQARAREGARIAREMHDSLGHRLTLITLYAGALRSQPAGDGKPGGNGETLQLLHSASVAAMDELREILQVLRSESPDTGRLATLQSVDDLVDDARSAGAAATLTRVGTPIEVPAMVELAAYRTLQEGITNALRHARGGAIDAALRYEDDALVAEVVNAPGKPHEGQTGGQGLYGLAERVRLAGGVLYHGPTAGGGFRVAATLPLTSISPRSPLPLPAVAEIPDMPDLQRADQRRRAWSMALGVGVIAVVGLCAGGVYLLWQDQTVDRTTYDGIRVGDDATAVRHRLPGHASEVSSDRPVPPGQDCVAYIAKPSSTAVAGTAGYRFCFQDGKLVSKEILDHVQ